MNFFQGRAKVSQGNICSEYFCNHNHFIFICIQACNLSFEKVLRTTTTLQLKNTSIRIHMKKLRSHKILNTFVLREHGCSPMQINPCFLGHIVGHKEFFILLGERTLSCLQGQPCPLRRKGPSGPKKQPCFPGRKGPELPRGAMLPGNKFIGACYHSSIVVISSQHD
jgi:hypothetical protein